MNMISTVICNCMQIILMAGLQGVGKTTACGKLALYLRKQSKKVLMVATDVYRPAAIEQLVKLGERIKVPVFEQGTDAQPAEIAAAGVKHVSCAIVRTGRRWLQLDTVLPAGIYRVRMCSHDHMLYELL